MNERKTVLLDLENLRGRVALACQGAMAPPDRDAMLSLIDSAIAREYIDVTKIAGWCVLCEEPNGCPHGHSDLEWIEENVRKTTARKNLPHEDYTKLLVTLEIPMDYGFGTFEERKARRARWFIFAHEARFGCKPVDCDDCHDSESVMKALDCDEHGNPNDA